MTIACFTASFLKAAPFNLAGPWWTIAGSSGVNRSVSLRQFSITEVGHISSMGRLLSDSQSRWISASAWIVLPNPISSARQAPNPHRRRKLSQENPRA